MSYYSDKNKQHNIVTDLEAKLRMIEAHGITEPLTFSTSSIITTTFPHSARTGEKQVLTNGNLTVTMYSRKGLPYGYYPRLIMFWLCREILRRNASPTLSADEARRIPLGSSLNAFLKQTGIIKGNSKKASGKSYRALRQQLDRLFSTTISMDWDNHFGKLTRTEWNNVLISEGGSLWWEDVGDTPRQNEAYVLLSPTFFNDVIQHAVPFSTIHLAGISRHPMAIDLYAWASLRIATHNGFTRVTWEQLKQQIGATYPDTTRGLCDFRTNVRKALAKVKEVWPEAAVSEWKGGLELRGHSPAVAKKEQDEFFKRYRYED